MDQLLNTAKIRLVFLKERINADSYNLKSLENNLSYERGTIDILESDINHLQTLHTMLKEDQKYMLARMMATTITDREDTLNKAKERLASKEYTYKDLNKTISKHLCELVALTAELESMNG